MQRYYRPEDISQDQAYKAGLWDVYASDEKESIELSSIIGRCQVAGNGTAIAQAGVDLPADPWPNDRLESAIICLMISHLWRRSQRSLADVSAAAWQCLAADLSLVLVQASHLSCMQCRCMCSSWSCRAASIVSTDAAMPVCIPSKKKYGLASGLCVKAQADSLLWRLQGLTASSAQPPLSGTAATSQHPQQSLCRMLRCRMSR